MATVFVLLAGVLLPCWGTFLKDKKIIGEKCFNRLECFSNCCLMNLDSGRAFCAPRARITMTCLPQTKGATNIICPCLMGLNCISRDPMCPRRCYMF
ncbi:colipase-like protein 2 [Otolemur garnettii]|uniref:Colipase like 2 n=1 Tax=Otolemur garnettii TaxID=30611 RepID=H0WU34_OTOGA|nr:colipase-like protein 2 [Otolemur garnettii]